MSKYPLKQHREKIVDTSRAISGFQVISSLPEPATVRLSVRSPVISEFFWPNFVSLLFANIIPVLELKFCMEPVARNLAVIGFTRSLVISNSTSAFACIEKQDNNS
jgi:hypothetical protein